MTSSQADADAESLIYTVFGVFKAKYEFYMVQRRPNPVHLTLHLKEKSEIDSSLQTIEKAIDGEISRLRSRCSIKNIMALRNFRDIQGRILLFEALHHPLIQVECAEGADIYTHEANLNFAYVLCFSQIGDIRTAPELSSALISTIKDYEGTIRKARSPTFDTPVNLKVFQAITALVRA